MSADKRHAGILVPIVNRILIRITEDRAHPTEDLLDKVADQVR